MDKTTTLSMNKPANGDFTGHWDVPLNENADLIDAEVTASRTELTGQSAAAITSYLKGSTASLATRLDVSLNNDGSLKYNDDDLEKSRYSGLEYRVSDPYDDIHKRIEALESRVMVRDEIDDLSGTCANLVRRASSMGFDAGELGAAVSPNMMYNGNLIATVVGPDINISCTTEQEFVIGGKLYSLKPGRTIVVATGGMTKGVLYAQGWNGAGTASGSNPSGGMIISGTGNATISTSVFTGTGSTSEIEDGDILVVYDGSAIYRYKILSVSGLDITIYGKFPKAFVTKGYEVYRMTEPKFKFVDTTTAGSIGTDGQLYKYANNDRNNSTANQFDRVAIGYCDGTTMVLFPRRSSMGGTEIVIGGTGADWAALTLPDSKAIPLTTGSAGLGPNVKAIIPIAFGTDSNGDGVILFNPSMPGMFTNANSAYTGNYFVNTPIFLANITYGANGDHTFDGVGTIFVNCMQNAFIASSAVINVLSAVCSDQRYLDIYDPATYWGVAIIY